MYCRFTRMQKYEVLIFGIFVVQDKNTFTYFKLILDFTSRQKLFLGFMLCINNGDTFCFVFELSKFGFSVFKKIQKSKPFRGSFSGLGTRKPQFTPFTVLRCIEEDLRRIRKDWWCFAGD